MGESSDLRAIVVDSDAGMEALAPAWWDLLARCKDAQPAQTPLWLLTWWRIFGGSGKRQPRVVVIESKREVLGIFPLLRRWVRRAGVVPVATLEWMGSGEPPEDEIFSEYLGPVAAEGHERDVAYRFVRALCSGDLGRWDELLLPAMNEADPMVTLLREALSARGAKVDVRRTHDCPYVVLPSSWDAYMARLDSHDRRLIRRTLRDLDAWAKPGRPVLRVAEDEAGMRRGWEILKGLHAERWGGKGVFESAPYCRFHEAVMPEMLRGSGGKLELMWLEIQGEPVAAAYDIVFRGNVQFYQSGRKMDVPRGVRPGAALQVLALQRAIESGYRSYDFGAQASLYKQQLAFGEPRRLVTLSAVAPTLSARATDDVRRTARSLFRLGKDIAGKLRPARAQAVHVEAPLRS